jgi:hypothetical protein
MAFKYQIGDYRKCADLDCKIEVIYNGSQWHHMADQAIDHVAEPHKHRFKLQPRIMNWHYPHAHLWFCECHYMTWIGKLLWTKQYVGAAWPQ